ncbi:proline and serine-rich protein 1 isoform X1 [Clupea harengus]|uniref:Proline and serine-rich protein 1 isoform X1 n=1 Tax=Clupea harengus TaxID=7950 RepID=A0A6P3VWU3_CLUHA|nr:proline and serine-rich protein 1 isoform X1 [Clupea harengus]
MDKKSFDIVLDEIRKCVLTDQRVKAIEQVHGYFSSEQVIDILKYFSWAEPQIKAVKALQHKMVAIPTTKVANILNGFTFTKDKLVVLELIALNICDAGNYRPVEDMFRTHLSEKKRARRILDQVCKVGCKAPVAMISSCGVTPGNPYPKGRPSVVTGSFPKAPLPMPSNNGTATAATAKKENEESTNEGKGIAARILGPCKPSPSTYNPHRPVPYPIPPCRVHATIAPSAYNNAGLMSVGGVITASVPPPPYSATAYTRPGCQPNPSSVPTTATISPHNSSPSTPSSTTPGPTTPITPVFPGMVPSQNPVSQSPTPSPSVIKGPPMSPHLPGGHSTPHPPTSYSGMPPSAPPSGTVIKSHTPTPCGTPGPSGSFSPSPYPRSRSGTPSGAPPTPIPRSSSVDLSAALTGKSYPSPTDSQLFPPHPAGTSSHSVIRSYTPTGGPSDRSNPMSAHGAHMPSGGPSPKPSQTLAAQQAAFFGNEQHMSAMAQRGHGANSGGSSPVPSAFKGPSRSGTPSLSSLAMPNTAALARSLGLVGHPAGSPQSSSPVLSGLQGMSVLASQQAGASPGQSPFSTFSSGSPFSGVPCSMPSSVSPMSSSAGLPPSAVYSGAQTASPFGLGLTTSPSMYGLPPGHSPQAFSGFGHSGLPGSPVLSSLMGLQGASSSVATVAPMQAAAAAAAAAAAGVPSASPVLPGFASAFSSNYNPALVGQPGLTSGLQAHSGGSFPGLLSFPGMGGYSSSPSPAALSGLHNPAMQSALLQAHSASSLEGYPPQPNGYTNYAPGPGTPFPLQPGLHWQ